MRLGSTPAQRLFQSTVNIRAEHPDDRAAVRAVNLATFDTAAEANLVDALRDKAQPLISLVAEEDSQLVGHIVFSPVTIDSHPELRLMGLAPMSVAPSHQNRGIGSALVRAGLQRCSELGVGAVAVLGHPRYYPRFGFQPCVRFGIFSEYESPPEAFMVMELQSGYLRGASGAVRYHAIFKDVLG